MFNAFQCLLLSKGPVVSSCQGSLGLSCIFSGVDPRLLDSEAIRIVNGIPHLCLTLELHDFS